MPRRVAIDTGPLVALFDGDDERHRLACDFVRSWSGRMWTTLPVVTEVSYLLDFHLTVQLDFLRWLSAGALDLIDVTLQDLARAAELVEKYRDLPADFADASLLAVCERLGARDVATFDSDFDVYRLRRGRAVHNLLSRPVGTLP